MPNEDILCSACFANFEKPKTTPLLAATPFTAVTWLLAEASHRIFAGEAICALYINASAPIGGIGRIAGCPMGMTLATGGGIGTVIGGGVGVGGAAVENKFISRAAAIRTTAISAGCSASSF